MHGELFMQEGTEHLWLRQPMHEIGRVQGERERERESFYSRGSGQVVPLEVISIQT